MSIKNPFAAGKRLASILVALAGIGIDANDEKTDVAAALEAKLAGAKGDIAAALEAKLAGAKGDIAAAVEAALAKERDAHAATTAVLRSKAEKYDALAKQAQEAGIDLEALEAEGGVAAKIDERARAEARTVLSKNAPDKSADIGPAPDAPPTGSSADIAERYVALREAGKNAEAEALFAGNSEAILAHITIALPGEA